MPSIAIVGAGFSGTIAAVNLRRLGPRNLEIILIDPRSFARGLAYATTSDSHLLNVPAGKMGAFAAAPAGFLDWLRTNCELCRAHGVDRLSHESFVPRRLYGRYLEALLTDARRAEPSRPLLRLLRDAVNCIGEDQSGLTLRLDHGLPIHADLAVLAAGNLAPAPPPVANPSFYSTDHFIADPWQPGALEDLDSDAPVLLIGSGLTAIDVIVSLLDRHHGGPIHVLSRHGLRPNRHADSGSHPPFTLKDFEPTARGITRAIRTAARDSNRASLDWRAVTDALRPVTQQAWIAMPDAERRRFVRHLRPFWDVHRHRIAPAVADRIDAAVRSGRLVFHAGRLRACAIHKWLVEVDFFARGASQTQSIVAARVINCSGPALDLERSGDPLIGSLIERGVARPDPLRLGLDVTRAMELIRRDGTPSRRLYGLGPITKGALWEIVAVPEIRMQIARLAAHLNSIIAAIPERSLAALG